MSILADQDRFDCWADFMRDISRLRESFGALTKAELRAAVDAMDNWINTNAISLNLAIPLPARTTLTTSQKARLFSAIVHKRFVKGV